MCLLLPSLRTKKGNKPPYSAIGINGTIESIGKLVQFDSSIEILVPFE